MPNASNLVLVEGTPSTVNSPASGSAALAVDTSNHGFTKDPSGNIWIPGPLCSTTTANSAAINTTETVINNVLTIPVGLLQVGTIIRFSINGTCTPSVANASTFTFRAGTLGTTSDQQIMTAAFTSTTTGTNVQFKGVWEFAVATIGATGTGQGNFFLANDGSNGITNAATKFVQSSGTNLATTTATKLVLTYKSAATTTTSTFQYGVLTEVLPV